eukprot:Sspe_Gene.76201::Locus_47624_Transcript_1_1_Confidence_1.000_Length_2588::g.76201::m.76201
MQEGSPGRSERRSSRKSSRSRRGRGEGDLDGAHVGTVERGDVYSVSSKPRLHHTDPGRRDGDAGVVVGEKEREKERYHHRMVQLAKQCANFNITCNMHAESHCRLNLEEMERVEWRKVRQAVDVGLCLARVTRHIEDSERTARQHIEENAGMSAAFFAEWFADKVEQAMDRNHMLARVDVQQREAASRGAIWQEYYDCVAGMAVEWGALRGRTALREREEELATLDALKLRYHSSEQRHREREIAVTALRTECERTVDQLSAVLDAKESALARVSELLSAQEELQNQLNLLDSRCATLERERDQARAEAHGHRVKATALAEELRKEREEQIEALSNLLEREARVVAMESTQALPVDTRLRREARQVAGDVAKMKEEVAQAKQTAADLEEEKAQLAEGSAKLQAENTRLSHRVAELQKEVKSQQHATDFLMAQLRSKEQLMNTLAFGGEWYAHHTADAEASSTASREHPSRVDTLRWLLTEKESRIKELETQTSRSTTPIPSPCTKCSSLSAKLEAECAARAKAEEEVSQMANELDEEQARIRTLRGEVRALSQKAADTSEMEELRAALASVRMELNTSHSEIAQLEGVRNALTVQCEGMATEMEQLKARFLERDQADADLADLRRALDDMRHEVAEHEVTLHLKVAECVDLTHRLSAAESGAQSMAETISRLQSDNAVLQGQNKALRYRLERLAGGESGERGVSKGRSASTSPRKPTKAKAEGVQEIKALRQIKEENGCLLRERKQKTSNMDRATIRKQNEEIVQLEKELEEVRAELAAAQVHHAKETAELKSVTERLSARAEARQGQIRELQAALRQQHQPQQQQLQKSTPHISPARRRPA